MNNIPNILNIPNECFFSTVVYIWFSLLQPQKSWPKNPISCHLKNTSYYNRGSIYKSTPC